ncbi:4571_t:CDS:2, partial [Funneliformis geosporum]
MSIAKIDLIADTDGDLYSVVYIDDVETLNRSFHWENAFNEESEEEERLLQGKRRRRQGKRTSRISRPSPKKLLLK